MNEEIVALVRQSADSSLHRINAHRFIIEAAGGMLTQEQCIRWVMCAGRESRSFPQVLTNMLDHVSDPAIRAVLQANLDDEFGNGNLDHAHFRHYIHLLKQLDISEQDFVEYTERAGVRLALDLAHSISQSEDPAVSLGYMLVNEGMTPITYGAVEGALKKHFPALSTEFFRIHVEVDHEHVAQLYDAIRRVPDDCAASLLFGIALGERGMAVLLDEALGLFDHAIVSAA